MIFESDLLGNEIADKQMIPSEQTFVWFHRLALLCASGCFPREWREAGGDTETVYKEQVQALWPNTMKKAFLGGIVFVLFLTSLGQSDDLGEVRVDEDGIHFHDEVVDNDGPEVIVTSDEPVIPEVDIMTLDPAGSPIFTIGSGKYPVGQEVKMMTMQNGAKIYFSRDNSEPNTFSQEFTGEPIVFNDPGEHVIKAICTAPEYRSSATITMTFQIQAAAGNPTIKASPLEGQPANISDATETYLGSFQDGVLITFESSTLGVLFYYTLNETEPSTKTSHYTKDHILISTPGNHSVRAIAKSENTFESKESQVWVHVFPRPPRPAFHLRSDKEFMVDMHVAYHKMADRHQDEVMRPADLETFITLTLNPDDGMCPECVVNSLEKEAITKATNALKRREGLHVDKDLKLYHGFVTRGSMFSFVKRLNTNLHDDRTKLMAQLEM